jgi:hypothetical protein
MDTRAIIGLLAILEGELLGEQLDLPFAHRLRDRFVSEGLLPEGAGLAHLRRALAEMNQRVRYARGEYAEPPDSEGPVRHSVVLNSDEAAIEFRDAAASLWAGGGPVAAPMGHGRPWVVYVDDDARVDNNRTPLKVSVGITEVLNQDLLTEIHPASVGCLTLSQHPRPALRV